MRSRSGLRNRLLTLLIATILFTMGAERILVGDALGCPFYDIMRNYQNKQDAKKLTSAEAKAINIVKNGYFKDKFVTVEDGMKKFVLSPEWEVDIQGSLSLVRVKGFMYLKEFPDRVCHVIFHFTVKDSKFELMTVDISVKDKKQKIQSYSYEASHKEIKELVDKMFEGKKNI